MRVRPQHDPGNAWEWERRPRVTRRRLLSHTGGGVDGLCTGSSEQYLARTNLAAIEAVGAVPFIPFRTDSVVTKGQEGTPWWRMYHRFALDRETFFASYHKRSNVETAFSMIKAKFGSAVRSKSRTGQINEVLAKVLCHNLCVLIMAMHEIGLTEEAVGFCTKRLPAAQEVSH